MTVLDDRYRERLLNLNDAVRLRLRTLYDTLIDPADLDASFAAFIPRVAPVIRAGQSAGVSLATGYLSALVLRDTDKTARLPILTGIVGTSVAGTLVDGMAAWPAMVKGQIANGAETEKAVDYGRYLAERFGDAEITRAVDAQTTHATKESGLFAGWRGVIAGTCEICLTTNSGSHGLGQSVYRHPGCRCSQQFVVRGAKRAKAKASDERRARYSSIDEMPKEVREAYERGAFDRIEGDTQLRALTDAQGFTRRPQVLSDAELDSFVRRGEMEFWRGTSKESYADRWLYGDSVRHGTGYYGNGTYTSVGRGIKPPDWRRAQGYSEMEAKQVAEIYSGDGGVVMRGTLRADARVLRVTGEGTSIPDLDAIFTNLTNAERAMDSVTHIAASRGYDGVLIQGAERVGGELGGNQLIILNRGATRMST